MPNEIPGWPILKAKSGPNGPRICIVAARPVVTVALVAFLAASMIRLWLGANSLAKNARNVSKAWDSELINGEFLLIAAYLSERRGRLRSAAWRCNLLASDRYDSRLSHTIRMVVVTALENDANRKSLVQTHPVQS